MRKARIFVFSGWLDSCIYIVNYLGHTGKYDFYVGDSWDYSAASYSKYCKGFLRLPPLAEDDLCQKMIVEFCQREGIDAVIPAGHHEVLFLSKYKEEFLKSGIALAIPDYDQVALAADKLKLAEFTAKHGIPYPKTYSLAEVPAEEVLKNEGLPLCIKTRRGTGQMDQGICHNTWKFFNHVRYMRTKYPPEEIVIQRFIEGGLDMDCMYTTGLLYDKRYQLKAVVPTKKIRSRPYTGGSGVCVKPVNNREVKELCVKTMGAFRTWEGIADVEVKYGRAEGQYFLIEINPRVWGFTTHGVTVSGVNIVDMLIRVTLGEEVEERWEFREDTYSTDLITDFLLLTDLLKDLVTDPGRQNILRLLGSYRYPYLIRNRYPDVRRIADLDPGDIKPFLSKLFRLRKALVRAVLPTNAGRKEKVRYSAYA